MKPVLFVLAIAAAAAFGTPAQAQNYPWCAQYGRGTGGPMNCGFSTYRQCMEDVSGIGGFCIQNNTYRPPAARRRHHVHP
ncbi:MAG TPA: DUF3551 domain-containing protein [Xanthobacteraceae bacterium]|nr:DUF3551 domain-containing protein [Xanthobacteraceae bacterium]